MTQHQPYAPPADDGGGQGSFSRPEQDLAQANPSDPDDREAAISHWQSKARPHQSLAHRLRSALFTLLIVMMFGSLAVAATYCNAPH
jgi:hypothetical protein